MCIVEAYISLSQCSQCIYNNNYVLEFLFSNIFLITTKVASKKDGIFSIVVT